MKKLLYCCDTIEKYIKEDELFCILDNHPFSKIKGDAKVYIMSDGGHGGIVDIKYCPFCGQKLIFYE